MLCIFNVEESGSFTYEIRGKKKLTMTSKEDLVKLNKSIGIYNLYICQPTHAFNIGKGNSIILEQVKHNSMPSMISGHLN